MIIYEDKPKFHFTRNQVEMNTYQNNNHNLILGLCDIPVMLIVGFTLWCD